MALELLGLIALLLLSGFFSSSELAYVVSNKIKIEIRARKNSLTAKSALYFIEEPNMFFSTILISNNVINIAFASLITIFLYNTFGFGDFEILVISSILLLLFGELIPKYMAREVADSFVMLSSVPLRVVTILLYPLVKVTSSISNILTNTENMNEESISHLFDKTDIKDLLSEGTEAGNVGEEEYDIINKVIELRDQRIYEAMTPRTDIVGIEVNSSIEDAVKVFVESGYSKIPVYEENIDNIKGLVHAYDMFKLPENISEVMREAIFVPETKKTIEMLNELLEKGVSVAIVVDEFGGTAGLVTLEDIIEEMLGEIRDEYDIEEHVIKQTDSNTYVLSGKVEIDHINEEYEIEIPQGDYETVAGYITHEIGRIPEKGEILLLDHFKIIILKSDKTKIDLIKLFIDEELYGEINEVK